MKVTSELNPGNDGAISNLYQIKIKQYGANKLDEQNSGSTYERTRSKHTGAI